MTHITPGAISLFTIAIISLTPNTTRASEEPEESTQSEADRDTHRSGYFVSSSGMMLEAGEGYLTQRELIYTAFGVGLTDFLTLELGTVLPLWVFGPTGGPLLNLSAGLKLGGNPVDKLHISMSAHAFALANTASFLTTLVSGNVTYGDADAHVSANLGVPWLGAPGGQLLATATFSGYYRLHRVFGGMTEHWVTFSPDARGAVMFHAVGGRFTPDDLTFDVGVLLLSRRSRDGFELSDAPPLPWFNVSWGFGG